MSSTAKDQFSIGTIIWTLLGLIVFALLTGIGIRLIPRQPRVGWFSAILFGTMCVVAVRDLYRQCGLDQDTIPDVKSQVSIRRAVVAVGTVIAAIFLGVTDSFFSFLFTDSFLRPGIFLGAFLTTLAFYPLRDRNERHASFRFWIIYSAGLGVFSVIISYGKDWLEDWLI
ncbi:MAG TPA: hypothetical protein VGD41_09170 [Pyrinomonadaceae bacterium]